MINSERIGMTVAGGAVQVDASAVDQAFETLKTYDWGADRDSLNPIDQAIIATHGDAAARLKLEKRLLAALNGGISRSAIDYVCRRLRVMGTAESVPSLVKLLPNENTSHISRYALERIPDEKAVAALRDALPKVDTNIKSGIVGSLGTLRDTKSIGAIAKLLGDSDRMVSRAAAQSLGLIGTQAAANELLKFSKKASGEMKMRTADACLICAEQMVADGKKGDAVALYKKIQSGDNSTAAKGAAMKGMVKAMQK